MRVGIDAHFVGVREGGNERYFESIIRCLGRVAPPRDEYFVFSYRGAARDRLPNGRVTHVPLRRRLVAWQRGVELPLYSRRLGLDVLHVPSNFLPVFPCRKVVTIHDLAFLDLPHAYAPLEWARLALLTRWAARRADHVLTVSEFTRAQLLERYGVPPRRVTVAPNAVDRTVFRPLPAEERAAARRRLGLSGDFLLFVGTLQPRKNVTLLLDGFQRLPSGLRASLQVVLAGRRGRRSEETFLTVASRGLGSAVRHIERVDTETLVALYNTATALVFPSLSEGFGLPILEAMSCGCPVVSSRTTSMPEVYGDAALAFDPKDPEELAAQLQRILDDAALRRDLVRRGFANCARYSWERSAALVADVYHTA